MELNKYEKTMLFLLVLAGIVFFYAITKTIAEAHLQENLYKILRGVK